MTTKSLIVFSLSYLFLVTIATAQAPLKYGIPVKGSSLEELDEVVSTYRKMLRYNQPFPDDHVSFEALREPSNYVANTLAYLGDAFYNNGMRALSSWGNDLQVFEQIIRSNNFKGFTLTSIENGREIYFSTKINGYRQPKVFSLKQLLAQMFFVPALHYYFAAYHHEDDNLKKALYCQIFSLVNFLRVKSLRKTVCSTLQSDGYQTLCNGIESLQIAYHNR